MSVVICIWVWVYRALPITMSAYQAEPENQTFCCSHQQPDRWPQLAYTLKPPIDHSLNNSYHSHTKPASKSPLSHQSQGWSPGIHSFPALETLPPNNLQWLSAMLIMTGEWWGWVVGSAHHWCWRSRVGNTAGGRDFPITNTVHATGNWFTALFREMERCPTQRSITPLLVQVDSLAAIFPPTIMGYGTTVTFFSHDCVITVCSPPILKCVYCLYMSAADQIKALLKFTRNFTFSHLISHYLCHC